MTARQGRRHHRILITNNTGTPVNNSATTILTVPGAPTGVCGFVNCSTYSGASPDPAFALRKYSYRPGAALVYAGRDQLRGLAA
jgi:hypothetical protein